MAALDFPASPSNGQTYTGPGGVVWIWDGSKWVTQGIGGGFYLPIAGGQMTGPLGAISGGPPTASINFGGTANTGLYGNANLVGILSGGQARFTVDNTAVFSTLPVNLPGAPTAPLHAATKAYVDTGAAAAVVPAQNNVGRNLIHNPLFNIAQRGAGPFTAAAGYTSDRWFMSFGGGSLSVQPQLMADASRTQIGDEAATTQLSTTLTGGAAAGDYTQLTQPIEDVRRLAGKTVTLSFWATAASALKLGANLYQHFGTGGSPSAGVQVNGQTVNLTTSWARYSLTFAIPSIIGKTLGTNANHYTQLGFWFSSGSTYTTPSGGVGVQSGQIFLWGVQLEIGSTMTPLEKPDPQQDLAKCQRFYQSPVLVSARFAAAAVGQILDVSVSWPRMRAAPTLTGGAGTAGNVTSATLYPSSPSGGRYEITAAAAGDAYALDASYNLSADL